MVHLVRLGEKASVFLTKRERLCLKVLIHRST
jgi:hypothetical protein